MEMVILVLDKSNAFCDAPCAYLEHEMLFSNNEAATISSMLITTWKGRVQSLVSCNGEGLKNRRNNGSGDRWGM
jgi:hypothetical protein